MVEFNRDGFLTINKQVRGSGDVARLLNLGSVNINYVKTITSKD